MRRKPSRGGLPNLKLPSARSGRTITLTLEDEEAELLDDLCEMIGVSEDEVFHRALALMSLEITKVGILMPGGIDDDDDDDE